MGNLSAAISEKLNALPAVQQQELLDFAEYLVRKYGKPVSVNAPQKRKAGSLKGFLIHMSDDFNAPLDDFKAYME